MWLMCAGDDLTVDDWLDELECKLEEALRELFSNEDVHTNNTEEPTDAAPAPQEALCQRKRKHNTTNEPEAKAALSPQKRLCHHAHTKVTDITW